MDVAPTCIAFDPVVSSATQIGERFSIQAMIRRMLVSKLLLVQHGFLLHVHRLLFLYYVVGVDGQGPRLHQHRSALHPYREGSRMHSLYYHMIITMPLV